MPFTNSISARLPVPYSAQLALTTQSEANLIILNKASRKLRSHSNEASPHQKPHTKTCQTAGTKPTAL